MADWLRSVRVRLTLVATLVTALAMLIAGIGLVRTVDDTLRDRQVAQDRQRLTELKAELEARRNPAELDLVLEGRTTFFQVVVDDRLVATTPGIEALGQGRASRSTLTVEGPYGTVKLIALSPLEPVERSVDAVRDSLLIVFPLLVAAVAILVWVMAGRALRPVEALRTEAEAITGSTLDRRVAVPATGDEIAALATTMNAMLDRIQEASLRQQRFVGDASHELRSPVAAIRTELEVAQRTATPDEWPAVAERLLGEEARLEAIISDLLLLATLDEAAPAPGLVLVDLAEEVRDEVGRRAPHRTDVTIDLDAPDPVLLTGNRTQLRRVVGNLIDNAGRHARTTVRVSVRAQGGRARVLVDDDGPGIPEADRERVFERFTRLDEHRARNDTGGGSGLGLSLVQRIVERHRGSVHVDTAPLGGARLVVDLPLAADLQPVSDAPHVAPLG
jgi:signal transduction histidine kinase